MFSRALSFNCDVSSWNTEKVTDMAYMFQLASKFNRDVSLWNTAKVKDMKGMFLKAKEFSQDLCPWLENDLLNVPNVTHMFKDSACPNKSDPSDLSVCQECED